MVAPTPYARSPLLDPDELLEVVMVPALATATPSTKSDRVMFFMFF
jgi:hypothetical protein